MWTRGLVGPRVHKPPQEVEGLLVRTRQIPPVVSPHPEWLPERVISRNDPKRWRVGLLYIDAPGETAQIIPWVGSKPWTP